MEPSYKFIHAIGYTMGVVAFMLILWYIYNLSNVPTDQISCYHNGGLKEVTIVRCENRTPSIKAICNDGSIIEKGC